MTSTSRPARVAYGFSRLHDSVFFVEEQRLRTLLEEVRAVKACSTLAEARALAPTLRLTFVPGLDEDGDSNESDPYDWSAMTEAEEGDWPPMLTQLSLDVFPRADGEAWTVLSTLEVGAHVERTVLNGDLLLIPMENRDAFLRALDQLGVDHRYAGDAVDVFEGHVHP